LWWDTPNPLAGNIPLPEMSEKYEAGTFGNYVGLTFFLLCTGCSIMKIMPHQKIPLKNHPHGSVYASAG